MEIALYGRALDFITEDAANYVLNDKLPETIEEFRKIFEQKNSLQGRDSEQMRLRSSAIKIYLGCGFRTKSFFQEHQK